MGEKVPCEFSAIIPCDECRKAGGEAVREAELTAEDAERYLPREGQDNMIVPKDCPIPPLSSIIRYGPDYYVLKAGRVMRENFKRTLPTYKQ